MQVGRIFMQYGLLQPTAGRGLLRMRQSMVSWNAVRHSQPTPVARATARRPSLPAQR